MRRWHRASNCAARLCFVDKVTKELVCACFLLFFLWANVNFLVKGTIPGGQAAGVVSVPSASCARLRALGRRDKMEVVEWGGKKTQDKTESSSL